MTAEEFVDPGADAIRAALASGKNSVTAAAKALGLRNRYVLYRLMRKHGIEP
jgi:transcriptional regulator of acetoin/glycerol metabolism